MNLGISHLARATETRAHHCDVKISKFQIGKVGTFTKSAFLAKSVEIPLQPDTKTVSQFNSKKTFYLRSRQRLTSSLGWHLLTTILPIGGILAVIKIKQDNRPAIVQVTLNNHQQ